MKPLAGYSHQIHIGSGSFSRVFRARQEKLDRDVVLKTVGVSRKSTAGTVMREARMIAAVQHPSVPAVYDVVRNGRQVVIVMEWIRGIPLSHIGRYLDDEVQYRTIATWIVTAVAHLHAAGIAHRDLKPENVIVSPDRGVVLVDFGFSVPAHRVGRQGSKIQGTPAYMAPELWSGEANVDVKRADCYALGMLLRTLPGVQDDVLIERLVQTDPQLRPSDAIAFEKEWMRSHEGAEPLTLRRDIAAAAAHHTASVLVFGVKELRSLHRMREAYELLTEALAAWPDSPEGLELLQNVFSTPIREPGLGRLLIRLAAGVVLLCLVGTAFLAGRQSLRQRPVNAGVVDETAMMQLGRVSTEEGGMLPVSRNESAAMKEIGGARRLDGVVSVKVPQREGVLLIDGEKTEVKNAPWYTTTLRAGTHRIEWHDTARHRIGGETVEVLPFATMRLSFERFSHD